MSGKPSNNLAFLAALAAASGAAALIYEIVWFQLLELAIGSTTVSLGILLATYMGGMCLGSLLLPRAAPARLHPLRVYAAIELGTGGLGLAVLAAMPWISGIYALRGAVAALCMLPAAMLMGATLPALARAAPRSETWWLGLIYAANLAGAVVGSLASGFYLLRVYDVTAATYAAAGINAGVGLAALIGGRRDLPVAVAEAAGAQKKGAAAVYVAVGLSGLCALGAEAIWTRALGLLFGASVYALSIIVAVFLAGLGLGSAIGSRVARLARQPRAALGWCQALAAGAIAWGSYSMSAAMPYWPIDPSLSASVRFSFELDLARACWALAPATLCWGASFPLALAAAGAEREAGAVMSGVYAANTLGAIAGALAASLWLVAWAGSQRAEQALIAVSMGAALLLLPQRWAISAACAAAMALLIRGVPPASKLLIAYGRYAAAWAGNSDIVYAKEGLNSSVAVAKFGNGTVTFHVAGKVQASNAARDMRLQRMLGHLTTLTAERPRSVLVIGCGAGITAGAAAIDPRVERETIVEIEPLVPEAASEYFTESNFGVLQNPKVRVRIDDGRHYLLTSKDRFDGITVDPLDPWVKGAANLYTKEFFEAMKAHLNPGGRVTMYVQLFETDLEAVKSLVATFFEVFPEGTLWGNPYEGRGHDIVLLGQAEPLRIDLDEMDRRFGYREEGNRVPESLAEIGMESPVDLFATYAGRKKDLAAWLKGAAINRDANLRMQYLAGLGLDRDDAAPIYAEILRYWRFPEDIFTSAEGRVDSLKRALNRTLERGE